MELKWVVSANENLDADITFEEFDTKKYYELQQQFFSLDKRDRGKYKSSDDYIVSNGGPSLSNKQQMYKRLYEEMNANLESNHFLSVLPVDIYTEKQTVMDMLASFENENYIKKVYKTKKHKVTKDLKTETATILKDCIKQGRSLLLSAQAANMLSKPLIDFYAASAYAYATIVINSPLHKALESLKGSHGHTYNHGNETLQFGGKIPSGTFIDLLMSINMPQIIYKDVAIKYSALPSLKYVQTHEINLSLIALLSTVPELSDQAAHISTVQNRVHELSIQSGIDNGKVIYKFIIGDGRRSPSEDSVKKAFGVTDLARIDGRYSVVIPIEKVQSIMPTIYHDIKGKIWFIEPLIPELYMPELCLHFLIISALCNIMRYSPHEWNNVLSNKISSEFSLLVSKYLRLFEIKYPMLLVEQLSNFQPEIRA